MIIGIDVSYYDPIVDWEAYNWDFVFVKESEANFQDVDFIAQWKAARGRTLRGAYHFFRPATNPTDTARAMVNRMGNDLGELPIVLDLEAADNVPNQDLGYRALVWLREVERLTQRRPIVYTSPAFIRQHLQGFEEFGGYPLWQATYPKDYLYEGWTEQDRINWIYSILTGTKVLPILTTPAPFKPARFIQWTGKCPPQFVPGYPLGRKDAVDVNFYRGTTVKQMFDEFNIVFVPGGNDMPGIVTLTANLKTSQLSNLRTSPGTTAGIKRLLTGPLSIRGVGAKIVRDGYHWIEIVFPDTGWVALTTSYDNVVYNPLGVDPQPTPTPTPAPTPIPVEKRVVKSTIHFSDGSTQDLVPPT